MQHNDKTTAAFRDYAVKENLVLVRELLITKKDQTAQKFEE